MKRRWPLAFPCSRRTFVASSFVTLLGGSAYANGAGSTSGSIKVGDFRRPGLSDHAVLTAAISAWIGRGHGVLELEQNHVYRLGAKADSTNVFQVHGLDGATMEGNGARIEIESVGSAIYNIFKFSGCSNLRIRQLSAIDHGYKYLPAGGKFLVFEPGARNSGGITIEQVHAYELLSFIHVQGPAAPYRVSDITLLDDCVATRVFYGINCQNQGDDIRGTLTTIDCCRSYFPFGVTGHRLQLNIHHQSLDKARGAETCILIKAYDRDTSDIQVVANFFGTLSWVAVTNNARVPGSCVTLEHQHDATTVSVIENVTLTINVSATAVDPYGVHRVVFRSLLADGSEQRRTTNIWREITIKGNLRPGPSSAIVAQSVPAIPVDVRVANGVAKMKNDIAGGFRLVPLG